MRPDPFEMWLILSKQILPDILKISQDDEHLVLHDTLAILRHQILRTLLLYRGLGSRWIFLGKMLPFWSADVIKQLLIWTNDFVSMLLGPSHRLFINFLHTIWVLYCRLLHIASCCYSCVHVCPWLILVCACVSLIDSCSAWPPSRCISSDKFVMSYIDHVTESPHLNSD